MILGEGRRIKVAQPAVRPELVVVLAVDPDDHPDLGHLVELLPVQAFVPEAFVEALHKAVLPRAARFDVQGPAPVFLEPSLDDLGDELRAVVASPSSSAPFLGCPVSHSLWLSLARSGRAHRSE